MTKIPPLVTPMRAALLALGIYALGASEKAFGLTINLTFDTDAVFMTAGLSTADIANMKAACSYAALQFTNNYSDNINVNIFVTAVPGTTTLGKSSTPLDSVPDYNTLQTSLTADLATPDDATTVGTGGSVPSGPDPISGNHTYYISRAQAKALTRRSDDFTSDGTFTFGGGFRYTYDPANRAVPGETDFIGVAMHEFSEIMGRISLMGLNAQIPGGYMLYDLFHWIGMGSRG